MHGIRHGDGFGEQLGGDNGSAYAAQSVVVGAAPASGQTNRFRSKEPGPSAAASALGEVDRGSGSKLRFTRFHYCE
jgi:hypothetical protein